jgi:hypothetical protein
VEERSPRTLAERFALCVCASALFMGACAVGRSHTSDSKLEQTFHRHEAEFEALLADVQADKNLKTIQPDSLIYADHLLNVSENDLSALERLGLTGERWLGYQKQLRRLGLAGGVLKGEGRVEFRADPGSIFNGDSYKGYEYTPTPPQHLKSNLDRYRIADSEKDESGWSVYKPLKGHWYLHLHVNR